MNRAIFIPIKNESQRVPGKNFRQFGDTELWKRNALKFSQEESIPVYIDTDSNKILEECKLMHNVHAYRRNSHLVGNNVSVNELIGDFIHRFPNYEVVCQVHVTSPFLLLETIIKAFGFIDTGFDSIVGATAHQSRFWRLESYGYCPVNHNPMKLENTQDLPELLQDNSALYAFTTNMFKRYKKRIGVYPYFLEIPFPQNIDIDTEEQFSLANGFLTQLKENEDEV